VGINDNKPVDNDNKVVRESKTPKQEVAERQIVIKSDASAYQVKKSRKVADLQALSYPGDFP
jgi:hypothetical protein